MKTAIAQAVESFKKKIFNYGEMPIDMSVLDVPYRDWITTGLVEGDEVNRIDLKTEEIYAITYRSGPKFSTFPKHIHKKQVQYGIILQGKVSIKTPTEKRKNIGVGESFMIPMDTPHFYEFHPNSIVIFFWIPPFNGEGWKADKVE